MDDLKAYSSTSLSCLTLQPRDCLVHFLQWCKCSECHVWVSCHTYRDRCCGLRLPGSKQLRSGAHHAALELGAILIISLH